MAFTALPLSGAVGHLVLAGVGLMPAGRLPGVRTVAVAATVGSGSRRRAMGMGLVAARARKEQGVPSAVVAPLSLDRAIHAGVVTGVYILSIGSKEEAAGSPALGSASGAGMLFLYGGASAGLGITSAELASASAAGGSGLVVAATAGSEAEGRDDDNFDDYIMKITIMASDALRVLAADDLLPATAKEQFTAKYTDVKTCLEKAADMLERSNQMGAALELMRCWYRIVELAHASYPDASLPALPGEQAFLDLCLSADEPPVILGQTVAPLIAPYNLPAGREMPDSDVDLIRSVYIAAVVCQAAAKTARDNYGA